MQFCKMIYNARIQLHEFLGAATGSVEPLFASDLLAGSLPPSLARSLGGSLIRSLARSLGCPARESVNQRNREREN